MICAKCTGSILYGGRIKSDLGTVMIYFSGFASLPYYGQLSQDSHACLPAHTRP